MVGSSLSMRVIILLCPGMDRIRPLCVVLMGNYGKIFCQPLQQAKAGLFDGKRVDAPGVASGLWWDGGCGEVKDRGEIATIIISMCVCVC